MNETGDGGNLYDDRFEVCNIGDTTMDVETSGIFSWNIFVLIKLVMRWKSVLIKIGNTVNPFLLKISKVPDDWVNSPHNKNKGESHFSEVDNPIRCSIISFHPKF